METPVQLPDQQLSKCEGNDYATFWTLPARMHDVQTRIRRVAPFTNACTDCRLRFQRRFVTL